MAFKTDTMKIIFMSLLLQVTLAQVVTPEDFYKIFNDFFSQQNKLFSENSPFDFNFDGVLPMPHENFPAPQPGYQDPVFVQNTQNPFYNDDFRGFPLRPYVPINTFQLEPDVALFLAFCNLIPIQVPPYPKCDPPNGEGSQSGATSASPEIPSTPLHSSVPPPVKDSTISNPPEQTIPSSSAASNPPPSTNDPTSQHTQPSSRPTTRPSTRPTQSVTQPTQPTTRPSTRPTQPATQPETQPATQPETQAATSSTTQSTTQSTTTKQPATNQRPNSMTTFTTEDPSMITIRLGDSDDEALASTTEEQYLPVNFDVVKPSRVPTITAPPVLHVNT